jgi:two-component system OmpR family response regulator
MKILVVDDDMRLAAVLRRGLCEAGHVVDVEYDGPAGERTACGGGYDAILLDVNLPGKDGFAIAASIRDQGSATPILMLTSRDTSEDAIAGLDAGADDYLRKPFGIAELLARIRSIGRRERAYRPLLLEFGTLALDPAARRAQRGERTIELTQRESAFLAYFLRNAGRALSRDMIAAALWPNETDIASNVIDVYVRRLRTKLHAPGDRRLISTVRGIGYRLEEA